MIEAMPVPSARCSVWSGANCCAANMAASTGTSVMPPPMPSSPARKPTKVPVTKSASIQAAITGRVSPGAIGKHPSEHIWSERHIALGIVAKNNVSTPRPADTDVPHPAQNLRQDAVLCSLLSRVADGLQRPGGGKVHRHGVDHLHGAVRPVRSPAAGVQEGHRHRREGRGGGYGAGDRRARRGDADVLFVHDQAAEEKFVADGFGQSAIR